MLRQHAKAKHSAARAKKTTNPIKKQIKKTTPTKLQKRNFPSYTSIASNAPSVRRHGSGFSVSLNLSDEHHNDQTQQQQRNIHTLKTNIQSRETYNELHKFLPPRDHPEYATRRNWISHLLTHKHTVLPDFVAQLGRSVHIIDVRDEDELLGPVGYIRGANWFPKSEMDAITTSFPKDGLIAVVCSNDADSRDVVRELKKTGHNLAAIVAGGMRSFKLMGLTSSRNPSILERRCVPVSVLNQKEQQRRMLESNKMGQKQMTLEQIISHLGTGDSVQFIKLAAFLTHGRLSCIDGRDDSGIIGAPGGDMGEFLIHLSVIEQLLGQPLTDNQVSSLFLRRLDAFGRCYLHSDQQASDRVVQALCDEVDPTIAEKVKEVPPDFALSSILQDIKKPQIEQVLDILTRPESLGCGHLKFMLTQSEKYRVREDLVRTALKCFFRTRWQGATECDFVVLSGSHEECGVANIALKKDIHSYTKIPLISPSIQHKQIFVNHAQISQYLRHQQCEWFLEQTDILPLSKTAAAAFQALVDLQAEHHAGLTVAKLAHNLPVYTLEFDEDHSSCVVHYNGIIGAQPAAATTTSSTNASQTAPAEPLPVPKGVAQEQSSPDNLIKSRIEKRLDCIDGTSKFTVDLK